MTKVQQSDPDLPSRSDSFLRMLELEKRYKMQRIQGHDPATITSPSTSSPSAQPNSPFKARRVSGHPPLSHQTQIMKAVRRSSALPSLSISIPPSPTDGPVAETNGLPGEQQPKEERTKTVTFSGHEEEDDGESSDQSSICQSPSWEQYGRKKKKKPKKPDAEQSKKSKEKKRGNKLSKVPPPHIQGVEPLMTANRAQSAPELDLYLKSDSANLGTPGPTAPAAMANQKLDGKPKSKGFLASFRLQHGNVAAVQKLIENQRVNGDGSSAPASPMLMPHPGVTGVDPSFTNPRKPPSIRSAVSNSTRSISSLDQLPQSARNSSGSSHGRSQSLLSSTLNKLKGPSYLYYRHTEIADSAQLQRPSSSREAEVAPNWVNDQPARRPVEQQPERPKERSMTSVESTQTLPDFTFPPKPKRATTQPTPDVPTYSVRVQARGEEPRDLSSGYESTEAIAFRGRRNQAPHPRAPSRESTMEKERRLRPERPSRAPRAPVQLPGDNSNRIPEAGYSSRKVEYRHPVGRQTHGYVQPQVETWMESEHEQESTPTSRQDAVNYNDNKIYRPEANLSREEEEDRVSIGTHASTIRPISRRQGRNSPGTDGRKHVTFPPSPNAIGRAVTSESIDEEAQVATAEPPSLEETVEVEEVISPEIQPRLERSADYFSFINQSYAPPSLDLQSPMVPSPRVDEEGDDGDLNHILRHISVKAQVNAITTQSDSVNQALASYANATGRIMRQKPSKNSPSLSSHYSDSDVPALERLGLSPKAARILAGVETASTSTSQSNTDPSRTSSERSSSSTCDDTPPSPSIPTPDSSRPQSHKELVLLNTDATSTATATPNLDDDERTPRMSRRPPVVEPPAKHASRPTNRDGNIQDDSWSRTALPIDLDSHHAAEPNKLDRQASSPPLVATPGSVTFADDVKGSFDDEELNRNTYRQTLPPRAQSALDIHSTPFLPELKHQSLYPKKTKAEISSISLPNSPPPELADGAPRKSALRASRKDSPNSEESSTLTSSGAAYLQEARKAAQIPPIPASRALRPHYAHKNSSTSVKSAVSSEVRSDPLAKMLVECCSCKFFHDMPSRVYECMAKPDSLVEDKLLGVSATITTMVKCPWCGHGMSTQCCSGYAAVVYLKEKLHGK
ncbi:hypothetical protein GGS26DRAFT_190786 [Hypomontagnella submonticulosa]|nr:hypothetical protein GGS26DRAFT_190786 [Hypomontagnella submonticulosa]